MTVMNQNFSMYAGNTKKVVVTVKDDAGGNLNITGSTVRWGFGDILKTTSSGITLSNPTSGEFTITLNPADTSSKKGTFTHFAELTDVAGNVTTILNGEITIKKGM
jgi:hypothetical protein